MDYALAKELKNAGFPMKSLNEIVPRVKIENDDLGNEQWRRTPTLEELIEACGKSSLLLESVVGKTASGSDVILYWICQVGMFKIQGDTAPEAVARLWLALNKK